MRVTLVNTLYAPYRIGGAERSVQLLAEGLARGGHRVSVVTLGEPHLERRSALNGVTIHRLPQEHRGWWPYSFSPGTRLLRAAWHLRDSHNAAMAARLGALLDEERPDILHTHVLTGFSVGVWGEAARRRIPLVHTLRDYYLMCPPAAMYRHDNCERICAQCRPFAVHRRRASRAVQAVVGVSRFILERHLQAGYFPGAAARVIFNPVAAGGTPRRLPSGGGLAFGFIGRVGVEKGIHWLLESFAAGAAPGSTLVVAGTGEPRFMERLRAAHASPAVRFLGHVEPAEFYRQVDVVVVPSLWNEPFGRTAAEPLAYGIPVIAANRGGLPEVVEDGVTGIVVDADDRASLARALGRFCADPGLAARLGAQCAQRLHAFSQDAIAAAYASLYAELGAPAPDAPVHAEAPAASVAGGP